MRASTGRARQQSEHVVRPDADRGDRRAAAPRSGVDAALQAHKAPSIRRQRWDVSTDEVQHFTLPRAASASPRVIDALASVEARCRANIPPSPIRRRTASAPDGPDHDASIARHERWWRNRTCGRAIRVAGAARSARRLRRLAPQRRGPYSGRPPRSCLEARDEALTQASRGVLVLDVMRRARHAVASGRGS